MENPKPDSLVKDGPSSKDYLSSVVNILTVVAALLTIAPFFSIHFGGSDAPASAAMVAPPAPSTQITTAPVPVQEECILESTDYNAEVSGYMATVTVRQRFRNPNTQKMDATYSFPLSDGAAIDDMTMRIGDRTIKGQIKESAEARAMYEEARMSGNTASLVEQIRSNIFTQSVANIEAGKSIDVTLRYTEMLPFANGQYSLVFPTQIGPRFIPVNCQGNTAAIAAAGNQSTHPPIHVNLAVNEGGIPITKIDSPTHTMQIQKLDGSHANVAYNGNDQSGKDMVINWQVVSGEMQSGYLAHRDGKEGFITAMIMPPKVVNKTKSAPKEMIFIVDCSGSQHGAPLEKAKDTLDYIVDHMNAADTFQIISFNRTVKKNTDKPMPVSASTKAKAHKFIKALNADGGTIMAPAIQAACEIPTQKNRLRIVTLMTDGYIGNDYEIIGMVKKLRGNSRWFPFGTGNSVNRALIDGMAREGGGEPEYVMLDSPSEKIAKHFYDRIASAVLTDVTLSCEGVKLSHVYPLKASDVWENRPLYFQATYEQAGSGTMVIKGFCQGKPYVQRVPIVLPAREEANSSIAQEWAHSRIEELMALDWQGMQSGNTSPEIKHDIIDTSVKYHVLSQFTSFIAVDSAFSNKRASQEKAPELPPAPAATLHSQNGSGFQLPTVSLSQFNPAVSLQTALSQSFSMQVNQLNKLNSVTNTGTGAVTNSGTGAGYSSYSSSNLTGSQTYNGGTSSAPMLQGATGGAPILQGTTNGTIGPGYFSGPNLAGATNGTIGPQGADATVIQGVNTAGAVRVNALATNATNIQNTAALAQYAWFILAASLLSTLLLQPKLLPLKRRHMWIACGLSTFMAFNVPSTVNWLMECASQANLLS